MDAARVRLDDNRPHAADIEHDPAVADAMSRLAVTAAAYGEAQVVLACELDGSADVVGIGAADDRRRPAIDSTIPDAAGILVGIVVRKNDGTLQPGGPAAERNAIE